MYFIFTPKFVVNLKRDPVVLHNYENLLLVKNVTINDFLGSHVFSFSSMIGSGSP